MAHEYIAAEMHIHYELQQKLIYELEVGPCLLKIWFVFIGVQLRRLTIIWRSYTLEIDVDTYFCSRKS